MGFPKIILGFGVFVAVALALAVLASFRSPYLRFIHRSQDYYGKLARGCDALLLRHPLGTNVFVHLAADDSSVPRIIRELHPSAITVSSNRVHVIVGEREFGMSWEAQDGDTHSWALQVYPAAPGPILYVEKRP